MLSARLPSKAVLGEQPCVLKHSSRWRDPTKIFVSICCTHQEPPQAPYFQRRKGKEHFTCNYRDDFLWAYSKSPDTGDRVAHCGATEDLCDGPESNKTCLLPHVLSWQSTDTSSLHRHHLGKGRELKKTLERISYLLAQTGNIQIPVSFSTMPAICSTCQARQEPSWKQWDVSSTQLFCNTRAHQQPSPWRQSRGGGARGSPWGSQSTGQGKGSSDSTPAPDRDPGVFSCIPLHPAPFSAKWSC